MGDSAPVSASMESSRHNSLVEGAEGDGSIEGANDLGGLGYDPPTSFSEDNNKTGGEAAEGASKTKQSGM